jgi:hypothetical protein
MQETRTNKEASAMVKTMTNDQAPNLKQIRMPNDVMIKLGLFRSFLIGA